MTDLKKLRKLAEKVIESKPTGTGSEWREGGREVSDASEVKRWWVSIQDQDGRIVRRDVERLCLAGPEPEPEGYEVFVEVMPVEDHDCIVAEKDAEIASLKAQLSMTNSNWPHEYRTSNQNGYCRVK